MNEHEAKTVAAVAAQCLTWGGWRRWSLIMRYGRLFTPGTDAGGRTRPVSGDDAGRHAYRRAVDSGLLYAEGYACHPRGGQTPKSWAWCLDGETVVDPGSAQPCTAYFGVPLRPGYLSRVRQAQHDDGFTWALALNEADTVIDPPLDPATDIVPGLGRDIPSSVRDWALTSARHPGLAENPPAWVMEELLRFDGQVPPGSPDQWLHYPVFPPPGQCAHEARPSDAPLPASHASDRVRRADWLDSGMALQCNAGAGGTFTDDGTIIGKIRVADSLDTLIRMADEHRLRREREVSPDGEGRPPEPARPEHAEAHLKWVTGPRAEHSFAVLHRLDYNVWDAWLHPSRPDGQGAAEEPPVRLTRNGVSYEMALVAVFRAMGSQLPAEFAVTYPPFTLTDEQRTVADIGPQLPMSYARYLIYQDNGTSSGMALACSGQTGGIYSAETDGHVYRIQDGDSLDTLIRMADEHRPLCVWSVVYRTSEREDPELTAQWRERVHLKWVRDGLYGDDFAVLRHLEDYDWDAWEQRWRPEEKALREGAAVRLTRNPVSYEMALAAVFRAMGAEMPDEFQVRFLY